MHDVDIHYDHVLKEDRSNKLFKIENFHIKAGEKVALLGANGKGKSTFINQIIRFIKEDKFDGNFKAAPNLFHGLFDQEQLVLNPKKDLHSEVIRLTSSDDITVKNTLIRAGFVFKRHNELVATLSGGEKSRLIFCVLYLKRPNFLILDEPTNHIDLDGKEQLAKALKESHLTALITGHDRFFIKEVADRYVLIDQGKLFEIDDPEIFYTSHFKKRQPAQVEKQSDIESSKSESILERIIKLETKLVEDKARKSKFQKPEKQKQWQVEIAKLYSELEN